MAGRSSKAKGSRAAPEVRPQPSITLDIVMPRQNGGADQQRPTFTSFDDAIARLREFESHWKKSQK